MWPDLDTVKDASSYSSVRASCCPAVLVSQYRDQTGRNRPVPHSPELVLSLLTSSRQPERTGRLPFVSFSEDNWDSVLNTLDL